MEVFPKMIEPWPINTSSPIVIFPTLLYPNGLFVLASWAIECRVGYSYIITYGDKMAKTSIDKNTIKVTVTSNFDSYGSILFNFRSL